MKNASDAARDVRCLGQVIGGTGRQVIKHQLLGGTPPEQAFFLTLAKLPEAQGVLTYWGRRLTGRRRQFRIEGFFC